MERVETRYSPVVLDVGDVRHRQVRAVGHLRQREARVASQRTDAFSECGHGLETTGMVAIAMLR